MSMREKLRKAVKDAAWNYHDEEWRDGTADMFIDAVLDTLMDNDASYALVSDKIVNDFEDKEFHMTTEHCIEKAFQAMIQAAKDGK